MKWEYIATYAAYDRINPELTRHGKQEWELVSAQLNDREGRWYMIFKRPVAEADSKGETF